MPHRDTNVAIKIPLLFKCSTRIESQPHRDTSVANKQDIYILIPNDGDDTTWLYINTGFRCFNATQGHKPSYTTTSIPNDEDDPMWLSKQGFRLAIHNLDINPKLNGTIHLNTSFRVSGLLSRSKQYGVTL